jgi:hypothetical protein
MARLLKSLGAAKALAKAQAAKKRPVKETILIIREDFVASKNELLFLSWFRKVSLRRERDSFYIDSRKWGGPFCTVSAPGCLGSI